MSFWRELKRRDVFKVAVAYLVSSWLIVQVIDVLAEPLSLPDVLATVVVVLLAIGLPFALIIAWIYEVTPEGIRITSDVDEARPARRRSSRRLTYVGIALLMAALGLTMLSKYLLKPPLTEFGPGSPTAVLPCDDFSPDPGYSFFASGIHDELINRLAALSGLEVRSRTSVMRYEGNRPSMPEIAEELNVDAIIECSARYDGNQVRLIVQLIDGPADRHLFQESYDADMSDVASMFDIQANIAMRVANALHVEFFEDERERIERIPTQSREAYELYLLALSLERRGPSTVPERIERLEQALQIDPMFVEAWLEKAGLHSLMTGQGGAEGEAQNEAAWDALDEALELAPDSYAVHARRGGLLTVRGDWIEAELAFRRAEELGGDGGRVEPLSMSVGDFASAQASLENAIERNPLYGFGAAVLLLVYDVIGDSDSHRRQWERGNRLFGDAWVPGMNTESIVRLGRGDVEFLRAEVDSNSFADIGTAAIWTAGIENFDSPADGLAAIRAVYADAENHTAARLSSFAMWAAHFGDTALALEWFREGVAVSPTELQWAWLPVFQEMRREPGFEDLIRQQGLPEFWRQFGWPEPPLCREISDDDFICDWPIDE